MRPQVRYPILALAVVIIATAAALVYYYRTRTFVPQLNVDEVRIESLVGHLLYDENGSGTKIYWTPAMEELAEMGPTAVPKLIEAIESAHEKAASVELVGAQRSEWGKNHDAEMIQARSAMVLGRIGDPRALPVLLSLKCYERRLICHYVDKAIEAIQEKAK